MDGFSAEYYKAFSALLAPQISKNFQHCSLFMFFPNGDAPSCNSHTTKTWQGYVSPTKLQGHFSDLKTYTKFLANRLMDITPSLIGLDQVGFVKGRQALDGTRRMLNLLRLAEITGTPSTFLALDAEKAFDRVHWGNLSKTLHKFGISGQIQLCPYTLILQLESIPLAYSLTPLHYLMAPKGLKVAHYPQSFFH